MSQAHTSPQRKATRRRSGNAVQLRQRLWQAVEIASEVLNDTSLSPELRLRGVHAVTQASGSYCKILEAVEFEARLKAVENKVQE